MAYKIFRLQPTTYSEIEDEMAILTVLHKEGIAPRPVALIDAGMEYRQNRYEPEVMFEGRQPIMRVQGPGHLPIIVTELVDAGPLAELPTELLTEQFDRFLEAVTKNDLYLQDCKALYDRENSKAILIDVGEVCHQSHWPRLPSYLESRDVAGINKEQLLHALVVKDLFNLFVPLRARGDLSLQSAARLLRDQGTGAIHELLLRHRG
jgi:hypothetical protein